MIIDSHVHFGRNSCWGDFPVEYLLELLEDVDYAVCSNLEGIDSTSLKNELDCNLSMLEVSKRFPKLKPLIVCQPNMTENADVVRKLLEENPEFVGLKIHPEWMKLPADSAKYDEYLRLAEQFKKPCLYHSGHVKSRFSSPHLIYKKAKEFPTVPIVLGHLSTGPKQAHQEAIEILLDSIITDRALLYVDVSWIDYPFETLNETFEDTLMLIDKLRNSPKGDYTHRILWATDAPVGKHNQTKNLYLKSLNIFKARVMEKFNDESLLANLLYNNAMKLYGIC